MLMKRAFVTFLCLQNANYKALEWSDPPDQVSISLRGYDLVSHTSLILNVTEKPILPDNAIEFDILHRESKQRKITSIANISGKVKRAVNSAGENDSKKSANGTGVDSVKNETKTFHKNLLQKNVASNVDDINKESTYKDKTNHKTVIKKKPSGGGISEMLLFLFFVCVVILVSVVLYVSSHRHANVPVTTKCKNTRKTRKIHYNHVAMEEPSSSVNSNSWKSSFFSKSLLSKKTEIKKLDTSLTRVTVPSTPIPTHSTSSTKTGFLDSSTARAGSSGNNLNTRGEADETISEAQHSNDELSDVCDTEGQTQNTCRLCKKCNGYRDATSIIKKINEIEHRGGRVHIPINIPVALGRKNLTVGSVYSSTGKQRQPRSRASTPVNTASPTTTDTRSNARTKSDEYTPPGTFCEQQEEDDRYSSCSASVQEDSGKYDYVDSRCQTTGRDHQEERSLMSTASSCEQNDACAPAAKCSRFCSVDHEQSCEASAYQLKQNDCKFSCRESTTKSKQDESCMSSEHSRTQCNRSYDVNDRSHASTKCRSECCVSFSGSTTRSDGSCDVDDYSSVFTKSKSECCATFNASTRRFDGSCDIDNHFGAPAKLRSETCVSFSASTKRSDGSCDFGRQDNSLRDRTVKSKHSESCAQSSASAGKSNRPGIFCDDHTTPSSTAYTTYNRDCTSSKVSTKKSNKNNCNHECSDESNNSGCTSSDTLNTKSYRDCSCSSVSTTHSEGQCDTSTTKTQIDDCDQDDELSSCNGSVAKPTRSACTNHTATSSRNSCGSQDDCIPFKAPVKIKVLSTDPNYEPNTLDVKKQLNQLLADKTNIEELRSRFDTNIKRGQVIYADVCFVKKEGTCLSKKSDFNVVSVNGTESRSSSAPSSIVKHYNNTPSECGINCQYNDSGPAESADFDCSTYKNSTCDDTTGEKNDESPKQYRECTGSVCSDSMSHSMLFKKFGNGIKKPGRSQLALKYYSSVNSKAGLIQNLNQRLKGTYLGQGTTSAQSSVGRCSPVSENPTDVESNSYEVVESPYEGLEYNNRSVRSGMHKFLPRIRQYMSKRRRNHSTSSEDPYYSAPSVVIGKTNLCNDCLEYLPEGVSETIKKRTSLTSARTLKGRSTLHLDEIVKLYPDVRPHLSAEVKEALSQSAENSSNNCYTPLCENYERGREMKWSELSTSFENLKCID